MVKFTKKEKIIFDLIVKTGCFCYLDVIKQLDYKNTLPTVRTHLHRIYHKVGVNSFAELIWAYYNNKIDEDTINE